MEEKLMIENLKELSSELWKHAAGSESITPGAWAESLDKAIATLERIRWRRTEEDEWISVKDRLPEDGKEVLCWYEYFRYGDYNRMWRTYGIGYCCNGRWGGEVTNGTHAQVIAWMPLPEMPEEEE